MKSFLLGLVVALGFQASAFAAETAKVDLTPNSITIGVIPGGNPEKLREQGLELAKEIQARLNIPVNIYVSKNYEGLIEAMKTKKVDFAFFSSMTYVFAEQQAHAKVLLKKVWEEPYYYSMIVTRKDSGIKKLEALKGKKVAFVDEKSSSGYLYPQVALKKKGLSNSDFKETVFTGNHQASIEFIEARKVDAAAVFSDDEKGKHSAWTKFGNGKTKYNILWTSSPIPNDAFCVRQDFYDDFPKVTHSLMFTLIDILQESSDKQKFSDILGTRDLMPATSKQYDPVREMVKALNIELKP